MVVEQRSFSVFWRWLQSEVLGYCIFVGKIWETVEKTLVVSKKEVWERTQKVAIFNITSNSFLNQYLLTFIIL